jgi:hypothetical protein
MNRHERRRARKQAHNNFYEQYVRHLPQVPFDAALERGRVYHTVMMKLLVALMLALAIAAPARAGELTGIVATATYSKLCNGPKFTPKAALGFAKYIAARYTSAEIKEEEEKMTARANTETGKEDLCKALESLGVHKLVKELNANFR